MDFRSGNMRRENEYFRDGCAPSLDEYDRFDVMANLHDELVYVNVDNNYCFICPECKTKRYGKMALIDTYNSTYSCSICHTKLTRKELNNAIFEIESK